MSVQGAVDIWEGQFLVGRTVPCTAGGSACLALPQGPHTPTHYDNPKYSPSYVCESRMGSRLHQEPGQKCEHQCHIYTFRVCFALPETKENMETAQASIQRTCYSRSHRCCIYLRAQAVRVAWPGARHRYVNLGRICGKPGAVLVLTYHLF